MPKDKSKFLKLILILVVISYILSMVATMILGFMFRANPEEMFAIMSFSLPLVAIMFLFNFILVACIVWARERGR